ncbi:MAG: hypothetical protein WC496_03425 [Phycisphaerae bacterium]|jgi:hypothetical protein
MDGNKISKSLSFWRHFEEPILEANLNSSNNYTTHTRQLRDEPEQRNISISGGTLTITNTREESDQDPGNKQYCAIPSHVSYGTKTHTFTREEPEQDESSHKYALMPVSTRG